jgi:hypothetical protein
MTYDQFLIHIINDGIDAAREDYKDKPSWLSGALAGFEACRGKTPSQLGELLTTTSYEVSKQLGSRTIPDEAIWELKCKFEEIQWVCNCVSALVFTTTDIHLLKPLIPPTARAVLKAAEVLRRDN